MDRIRKRHMHPGHQGGDKKWFGFALLMLGLFILAKKLNFFDIGWHDAWPWMVIAIGMFIALKSKFRNNAWWILTLIGVSHLIPVFYIGEVSSKTLLIPAVMIVLGLVIIFRPARKKKLWDDRCGSNIPIVTSSESTLNIDVTFGGHKEIVTSKDFKGGSISTTFGGAEVNLMNADSTDKTINLNMKVAFGGVELVVPSHWQVKNEISNTLGSVEDNRNIYTHGGGEEQTTLVLTGSCSFGSIEIKSY